MLFAVHEKEKKRVRAQNGPYFEKHIVIITAHFRPAPALTPSPPSWPMDLWPPGASMFKKVRARATHGWFYELEVSSVGVLIIRTLLVTG